MAGALPIDPEEWDLVIDKLVRFHDNIQLEIKELVNKIKQEMNGLGSSMVPLAEEKSIYGKVTRCYNSLIYFINYCHLYIWRLIL